MATLVDVDNALNELDQHVKDGLAKIQIVVTQLTGTQDFQATVDHIKAIEAVFDNFVTTLSPPAPVPVVPPAP